MFIHLNLEKGEDLQTSPLADQFTFERNLTAWAGRTIYLTWLLRQIKNNNLPVIAELERLYAIAVEDSPLHIKLLEEDCHPSVLRGVLFIYHACKGNWDHTLEVMETTREEVSYSLEEYKELFRDSLVQEFQEEHPLDDTDFDDYVRSEYDCFLDQNNWALGHTRY